MIRSIKKLINNLDYEVLSGKIEDIEINKLCYDSRTLEDNDLFICLKGARFDTHSIIPDIISKGASVIVVDKGSEYVGASINVGASTASPLILAVDNTRKALSIISANYFDQQIN